MNGLNRLILLASLAAFFVLSTVPALAQGTDVQPNAVSDQYRPDGLGGPDGPASVADIAEDAVEDIISKGGEADGAAAYEAALNAAREAGVDRETAEVVATEAVAEVSEPEITELPDTGGVSVFVLGAGLLVVGAGLLTRRLFT